MSIEIENYVTAGKLQIRKELFDLVKIEIAPKTGVTNKNFWSSVEKILQENMEKNAALLKKRDRLQTKIDAWHIEHKGKKHKPAAYKKFLK